MNANQARQVLLRHRPGPRVEEDPELEAALAFCERDPETQAWWVEQARVQTALRKCFRQITPPAGLKEQILSEHFMSLQPAWWQHPRVLAAAAALLFLVAGALFWLQRDGLPAGDATLAAFRTRMVKEASRLYQMEFESGDLEQIRRHLADKGFPADFTLSESLAQAPVTGCLTTRWQNAKVTMVCFLTDPTQAGLTKSDLWLFVVDQGAVKDAPDGVLAARVNRLFTATWTHQGKLYLLGTAGDEAAIRKWL